MLRKLLPTLSALIVTSLVVTSCSSKDEVVDDYDPARDYFTFANTEQFVTEHLALDLNVDFESRELRGFAMLSVRRIDTDARELVLDTRDLTIKSAALLMADSSAPAEFRLGETHETLGTPLYVAVPDDAGERFDLMIEYNTSPQSTALQ